jgi:hypothetical protein
VKDGVGLFVNIIVVLLLDKLYFSLYRGVYNYSNLIDISIAFMVMKPVKENKESSVQLMSFRAFPVDPAYKGMDCIVGMNVICFRFKIRKPVNYQGDARN